MKGLRSLLTEGSNRGNGPVKPDSWIRRTADVPQIPALVARRQGPSALAASFEHANGSGRSISTLCQAGILSAARGRPRGPTNQNNG
jgi:hypothetical protein